MSDRLSYTVEQAAEATGLSRDFLKAAIHTKDPKRQLRAKAASLTSKGAASKFVILRGDLEAWLEGMADA